VGPFKQQKFKLLLDIHMMIYHFIWLVAGWICLSIMR